MTNNVSVNRKASTRTSIILLLVGILVVSSILTAFIAYQNGFIYNDFSQVATVNGEPIYVREYRVKLKSSRTEVLDYFSDKYGVDSSSNFWTSSFNGEIPDEIARQRALDDIVRVKVQQILAKERSIIKSANYKVFLKELEKENKHREDALKGNKVIYGPGKYGEIEYFSYTFDNMVSQLKEKLKEKELSISEDRLVEMYKLFKDTKFMLPDNLEIQSITVSFADDKGVINDNKKKKAEIRINEAKKRIDSGESFEAVAKLYNENDRVLEYTFTKEEQTSKDISYPLLLDEAVKLEPGQISGIIERGTDYTIIKCIKREDMGYLSYEEAKDMIKDELIERDYAQYIDDLVKEADIKINEKVYKRMTVRQ